MEYHHRIEFEGHRGYLYKNENVVFYEIQFENIIKAMCFLKDYPSGPRYEPSKGLVSGNLYLSIQTPPQCQLD